MKDQVMKMQSRDVKMIVAMFLVLVSPLVAMAQVDDVYFVPTKENEEKVLVVKSTAEKYNIDNTSASSMRNVDEYNRRSTAYTNAPDEYIDENYTDEYVYEDDSYDDYSYSTRIIRFRNPRRAVYSSIYWDLMYGCGINDWLIYDNGYSIDIYPTYNNPYYFWSDFAFSWNPFSWYSWHSWHHAAHWGWHHPYYSHYYGHCYDHYYGHHNHIAMRPNHNYWSPLRRNTRYIPTNGAVGGRYERGEGSRGNRVAASNNNSSGRVNLRGSAGNRSDKVASADRGASDKNNSGRVNLRGNAGNRGNNAAQSSNKRNENGAGFKIGSNQGRDNAIRRQQPARGSANVSNSRAASSGKSNSESVRQQKSNSTSNNSNRGTSVNRRGSGSSSGYNRPSSTSVTRSRNSSSSENRSSSSYSRSSGSSRNNSSSYSRGSSSRSSSSFGGGSRSGSSGGSRSGGSRGGGGRGR